MNRLKTGIVQSLILKVAAIIFFIFGFSKASANEIRPAFIPIVVGDITTFIPLLPPPGNVSSSSSGVNAYDLSWDSVSSASYYQVLIFDENGNQNSRKVTGLSYALAGLPLGESAVSILACNARDQCGAPAQIGNYVVSERITYIHSDFLGSPILKTDELGNEIDRFHYKPFGDTEQDKLEEVGYAGHMEDTDLDLTYMQARYYDPYIGRFYSNDPVDAQTFIEQGNVQGFNRYAYANNNPYKYVDPDGRAGKVASGVIMVGNGIKKVGRLSKAAAVRLRRQGKNIHSDNKQVQMQIEKAANVSNNKILDHSKGHQLKNSDGSLKVDKNGDPVMGAGHIQTDGVSGHNFAGSQGVVNSIAAGAAVGLEAVGDALEAVGEGLEKVEETLPRTMQLLDPMGTIMEQMNAPPPCENCEA